ncbi:hypothetical protein [Mesorhizobium sp.]|uniref:hypothetical protein n=1 Tax=Mesorhizobium sp. TaxID=1871066 RepID=UPI0012265186|nr:hypothetical protein [Mesorhizobium sp.]TIX28898.1 MAG: hypothetical protein E5V35_00625 [Mesorhizobium sp.]
MNDLKVFSVTAKHYHPDDGYHDPDKDVNRHYIIALSGKEAIAAIRDSYGGAWEMRASKGRALKAGLIIA